MIQSGLTPPLFKDLLLAMRRLFLRFLLAVLVIAVLALVYVRASAAKRETETAEALMPGVGAFVETPAGRIFTLSDGPETGQIILLAHGTGAWSGFWQTELSALAQEGYRAIAFDMPPFGFSDRAEDGDYSRARQAERIHQLVATLDHPPIVVAHSFGAAAATEAVLQKPDAFAGLVIVNGAIGMGAGDKPLPLPLRPRLLRETAVAGTASNPRMTRRLFTMMIHRKEAATERQIKILQLPLRRKGTTRAYAQWLPSLLAPAPDALSRTPENYANLGLPVRIIWGDKDTVTPPEQAEALAGALGQEPVHYIQDVGHVPHIEAPGDFRTLLRAVLREMQ